MRPTIPTDDIDRPASPPEESGELDRARCPLCHTRISRASAEFPWQCRRCAQQWSARRLATVAAYATWVDARELPVVQSRPDDTDPPEPLLVTVQRIDFALEEDPHSRVSPMALSEEPHARIYP